MQPSYQILSEIDFLNEIAGAPLGDARRSARFVDLMQALRTSPGRSIPDAMGSEARVEAYYRFVRNTASEHRALLEPHFEEVRARCAALGAVLAVHDTTECAFEVHDEPAREHLPVLNRNRQGFHWHATLALSADGTRAPLGLVASRPFVHESKLRDQDSRDFWEAQHGILNNEQDRWLEAVEETEARLEDAEQVIHVMDREGDDYSTLLPMALSGYSFVVRMVGHRNVCDEPTRTRGISILEALDEVSWEDDERIVALSARPGRKASPGHPVRRARDGRLKLRAMTTELRRPNHVSSEAADRFTAHVIEVLEIEPPDGGEPVNWLLVTDQPIESAEDCWSVVDIYRARWVIEEYFKALKTGAAYTKLQHRSAHTLLAALAAKAIIAWDILVLRHIGQHAGDAEATSVISLVRLKILRMLLEGKLSANPTAREVMMAVASLGGHLRSNGPPGWQTLGRGWQKLLTMEEGFRMAMELGHEM